MTDSHEFSGSVERILFHNQENGYAVFILKISANNELVATGPVAQIQAGQQVTVQGYWVHHPKFGKQFQVRQCSVQLPTSVVGIEKYLGSGLIKGIGKVYAQKIVARFKEDTLTIIEQQTDRLLEIDGIGTKRIELIKQAWQEQKAVSNIMIFLQEKGVSPIFAAKIYKHYGAESIAVLQGNPYKMAEDIWGVGFKTADALAAKLGIAKNSIKRIKAGIRHTLTTATSQGHLYIEVPTLKADTTTLLELMAEDEGILKHALHELYDEQIIKLITYEEKHFVGLVQYYFSEKGLAGKIIALQQEPTRSSFNIPAICLSLQASIANHVELNEDQKRAIVSCLEHKVSIITGGPGTGKTTLIKRLLSILEEHNIVYKLAAPTGRAAKRMAEGTHRYAATIHRLLEFDPSTMQFVHNEKNALALDFLIIDEASMLDVFLAHAVLKALPLRAHIVFIGDIDQLPSVGAGNVLSDMLKAKNICHTRLHHIFRQAADSLIVLNAHRINKGDFPVTFQPDAKKDFFFIKEENPAHLMHHLNMLYNQNSYLAPYKHDVMVLAPMNRGIAGTTNLNYELQKLLNSAEKPFLMHAGTTYKVGDRVMQMRNNYDKGVFNGDIGTIVEIDMQMRTLTVQIDERLVEYEGSEVDELVLAYAISIHKSQGSEYAAVIIPIFIQHFMLLQRNLLYTAVTRAKRLCIIIGQPKAVGMAIRNNKMVKRNTFLTQFLTTDLTCR